MANEWMEIAKRILSFDEFRSPDPYWDRTGERIVSSDELGHPSIGVGRNLNARPLDDEEIDFLLERDIQRAVQGAKNIFDPFYDGWSAPRRHGLMSLVFNLGEGTLRKFTQTVPAIRDENWDLVETLLHKTKWARDVDPKQRPGIGRDDRVIKMICREEYDAAYQIN